jgi:heme-degrading monooxygenase HmoA
MIVVVFRSRLRPGVDFDELGRLGARMHELATSMPGFVEYKDFSAQDGENVTVVQFESLETLEAWRTHPEHRQVQQRAREALMSEYHIQVCETVRDYGFSAPA